MRFFMQMAFGLLSFVLATPILAADFQAPVRIGLASVVLSGDQAFLPDWKKYLEEKIGRRIVFRFPDSCRKVTELLQAGRVDFAWIGGFCYVANTSLGYLQLMTVPVYRGEPSHRSFIIVHRDSSLTDMGDLRGRVFAFSDPESNTGFAYPLTLLPRHEGVPEPYFRQTFFTFTHAGTVQAVADQLADGGAVDSYVWEYLASIRPELTRETRVIGVSPKFGFSPMVYRVGIEIDLVEKVKSGLETMHREPVGKSILAELRLDEFRQFPPGLFNSTRRMLNWLQTRSAWAAAVIID